MSLPNSYTVKPGSIPDYFEAILNAEPPNRFNNPFLVNLDFKSTNDRLIISILKDLGFIDTDGAPKQRYFDFLDQTQSKIVLADAIKDAYSDLFAINKEAYRMTLEEVKNKFKTLYAGTKKDIIIQRSASTFVALCDYADFTSTIKKDIVEDKAEDKKDKKENILPQEAIKSPTITFDALQYHINIVLPESRDQAVYDAIFKSLRDHLGR